MNNNILNAEFLEISEETSEPKNFSRKQVFNDLSKLVGKDTILKGFCSKCDKEGNLDIIYNDFHCILKRDDVTVTALHDATGHVHKANCQNKVGLNLFFRVKEIKDNSVYVERRSIIEEQRLKYLDVLSIGGVLTGRITAINEAIGCFVDIGADYTAILPKKNLEHVFVSQIKEHVSVGQTITAAIIDLTVAKSSKEFSEIVLDRKAVLPTYAELVSDYKVGDVIIGEISSINTKLPAIYANITTHLTCICSPNPQLHLLENQKVRIRLKHIRKTGDGKMSGEIISAI